MREYLKITAGGLIVALTVVPAFAQTGTRPQAPQQAPRDQSGMSGGTSTDPAGATNKNTNTDSTQDSQMKNQTRDSSGTGGTSGTMSRDNTTGNTGTMPSGSMRGMRGTKASPANVRQVQEALKAQGHDPGPIDGKMGPQTQEALRAYQQSQNLTETGQLDQQTADKLGVRGGTSQQR